MNPTIELVYSPDCPNVDLARTRLQEALSRVGIEPRWVEWNRESGSAPAHARRFGSPTVLINGRDVAGIAETEADCCRVYADAEGFERAPTVDVLETAVRRAQKRTGLSAWAKWIGLTLLGASTFEASRTDLSRHKWISFLLWRLPLLLLAAGAFWEPGRGLLWTGGFGWIGSSCVLNAFRCGRTHCAIMGPLFLALSFVTAVTELGVLVFEWTQIGLAGVGFFVLSYVPEWLGKRYLRLGTGREVDCEG